MKRSELSEFDRDTLIALGDAVSAAGHAAGTPLTWLTDRELSRKSGMRIYSSDLNRLQGYGLAQSVARRQGKAQVVVRWRPTQKGQQWRLHYKRQRRMAERIKNSDG